MTSDVRGAKDPTPRLFRSPAGLLVITALSIFAAEAVVMAVISALPQGIPLLTEALIDASLLTVIVVPVLYFFFYRPLSAHMAERVKVEESREKLIGELKTALEKIKVLSGLLPVCAACKRIRDDGGGWRRVDEHGKIHLRAKLRPVYPLDMRYLCGKALRRQWHEIGIADWQGEN